MNSTKTHTPEDDTYARPGAGDSSTRAIWMRASAAAVVLAAAFVPWLVSHDGVSDSAHGKASPRPKPAIGKWGRLEYTPIVISPPLEFIRDTSPEFHSKPAAWSLPHTSRFELAEFFKQIKISPSLSRQLVSMAQADAKTGGMTIRPSRQFIFGVSPEDRAALYTALGAHKINGDQRTIFPFQGKSLDDWLAGTGVSAETIKLIEPLIYRRGYFMYFADLRVIGYLHSRSDRLNLLRALPRVSTFLAHLKISADSDIDRLVKYWGRGGRENEVRPILEAMKRRGGRQSINITHLLPPLARRRLYTYPGRSDSDMKSKPRDCHWTTMNFFCDEPDDRFCDAGLLARELKANYYRIGGNLQLGDLILVVTPRGKMVHSAVYIADDMCFHRCGADSSVPWSLTRRKHLESYYPSLEKREVMYFRHNSM